MRKLRIELRTLVPLSFAAAALQRERCLIGAALAFYCHGTLYHGRRNNLWSVENMFCHLILQFGPLLYHISQGFARLSAKPSQ
ncbi:hypothetical protein RCCS2_10565 [Roseobacter sp. CCS2]|nr:hypothetical protein RCCS2_10565 [Roseobacter sp. CCS2]